MTSIAQDGTVTTTVVARVHGDPEPVSLPARLSYNPADPFAVTLLFTDVTVLDVETGERHEDGETAWLLPRDLLSTGHPAGDTPGELLITRPTGGSDVHIQLYPGTAAATTIVLPRAPLDEFLSATARALPASEENLDRVLRLILASG